MVGGLLIAYATERIDLGPRVDSGRIRRRSVTFSVRSITLKPLTRCPALTQPACRPFGELAAVAWRLAGFLHAQPVEGFSGQPTARHLANLRQSSRHGLAHHPELMLGATTDAAPRLLLAPP